jgi:predicted O-methyltransferase YrrM
MSKRKLPTPVEKVEVYYEKPIDRFTGNYTVTWDLNGRSYRHNARTRFTDFEGYWPPLHNLLYLPKVVKTYFEGKKQPILNNQVPFLVYDAIKFLDKIVKDGMRILELGGGNSTLWFLKRKVQLTTIEDSSQWGEFVSQYISNNPQLKLKGLSDFEIKIMQGREVIDYLNQFPDEHFDLVLVDSSDQHISRNECVKVCMTKVKKNGWLVLDNSDHPGRWWAVDMMEQYKRIRFTGYVPMALSVSQTSFWKIT